MVIGEAANENPSNIRGADSQAIKDKAPWDHRFKSLDA
jgi:hypothetical protein